jgi:hypothetical protein
MVRCGQCNNEYETEEDCKKHICAVTGVNQEDPKSMGVLYEKISEQALKRGQESK